MKIYIIYATEAEVEIALSYCKTQYSNVVTDSMQHIGFAINATDIIFFARHGIGVMHASNAISNIILNAKPNLIIQAGIAGCYNTLMGLGNVYTVAADRLADIGAQDDNLFLSIYDLQLENKNDAPYTNGWLFNTEIPYPIFFTGYTPVNSITVNTTTGNAQTILQWQQLYKPTLETMEGAALHYACLQHKIAFVQLRATSNYVTVRNKSTWQIPMAIQNLNTALIDFFKTLP